MKRRSVWLWAGILLLLSMLSLPAGASGMTAALSGPDTVRAGDSIEVSLQVSGNGLIVTQGEIRYSAGSLSYQGTDGILSGWKIDIDHSDGRLQFLAEDDKLSAPINGTQTLCVLRFTVRAAEGAELSVLAGGLTATDGNQDFRASDAAYSARVAPPLSGNNALKELYAQNVEFSPAFRPEVTAYTAQVPFSVSSLDLTAVAADSRAQVQISGNTLRAGAVTAVTVTVTAENGSRRSYVIQVSREQDPDYEPSGENRLSSLTVDGFLLSPGFAEDVLEYVVWLPYETESVSVSGEARDSRASVEVTGGQTLTAGADNPVLVICTAENGDTRTYTVVVKRAAAHGLTTTTAPSAAETTTTAVTQEDHPAQVPAASGIPWWSLLITGLLGIGAGAGGLYLVLAQTARRRSGGGK